MMLLQRLGVVGLQEMAIPMYFKQRDPYPTERDKLALGIGFKEALEETMKPPVAGVIESTRRDEHFVGGEINGKKRSSFFRLRG